MEAEKVEGKEQEDVMKKSNRRTQGREEMVSQEMNTVKVGGS